MECFPLNIKGKARIPTFSMYLNMFLEFLASAFGQEKEIKDVQIGNEGIRLSTDNMILYVENPIESA